MEPYYQDEWVTIYNADCDIAIKRLQQTVMNLEIPKEKIEPVRML